MKKFGVSFAFVLLLVYIGASTVSAESYKVQEGDSLWKIAEDHDTTVDDLKDINELKSNVIQPKQELTIQESYTVEKGDTLSVIAKDFDVTVDKIKDWNKLDTDIIQIDQKLKVKGKKATESTDEKEGQKSTEEKAEKSEEPKAEAAESKEDNKAEAKNDDKAEATENKETATATSDKQDEQAPEGKTFEVTSTAYTAKCEGCSGVTSTGVDLNEDPNAKVIAVDPDVIPLGSEVYVEGYGYATAADTGGAINGNKIDVHVPSKGEATNYGVQTVNVTIVE